MSPSAGRYDRDRIVASVDLGALADELLGPRRGTGRSGMWRCPNAQHAQTGRTPPVSIFADRRNQQRWHCHGCGAGGTAIDLVMATKGLDVRSALDLLAARTGTMPAPDRGPSPRPVNRAAPAPKPTEAISDPDGLAEFIESCARRLWQPAGRPVLRWLTEVRGLPPEVLRANHVGADAGAHRQARPIGMPRGGWAAVFPVHDTAGRPVFAQLRLLQARPGQQRYLNAARQLAPNPRVALYQPATPTGSCTLITEGVIDGLSAAAGGHRAAALFGAAVPEPIAGSPGAERLAAALTALPGRLVCALDPDPAGELATHRLRALLAQHGRAVPVLHLPAGAGDLNDWMRACPDWTRTLCDRLRTTLRAHERSSPGVSR